MKLRNAQQYSLVFFTSYLIFWYFWYIVCISILCELVLTLLKPGALIKMRVGYKFIQPYLFSWFAQPCENRCMYHDEILFQCQGTLIFLWPPPEMSE